MNSTKYSKWSKCPPPYVLSQPLSETRASFVTIIPAENCPISSAFRLSIQKLLLASDKAFKRFVFYSPDKIPQRDSKYGENQVTTAPSQSFTNSFGARNVEKHSEICTEPHASRLICRAASDSKGLQSSINFGSRY